MVIEYVINAGKKINFNMPDISMCSSESCPLKEKCYRVKAKPDPLWQTYSDFSDSLNEDKTECKHFMENGKNE